MRSTALRSERFSHGLCGFPNMEHQFIGQPLTRERCCEMADALAEKIPEIAGIRESTKYKYPVAKLIAQRLLIEMGERFIE